MLRFLDDLRTALLAPLRMQTPGTAEQIAWNGVSLFASGDALLRVDLAHDLTYPTWIAQDAQTSVGRTSETLAALALFRSDAVVLKRRNESIEEALAREARVLRLRQKLQRGLGLRTSNA